MNRVPTPSGPCEQTPPSPIGLGEPPKHDWAQFWRALLIGLLVLTALVGIWEFAGSMGWVWLILLALVAGGGRFALAAYGEYLLRQGHYDQVLRLAPILSMSSVGRNRLRACALMDAGRYQEAARALRDVIHRVRGRHVTMTGRVKLCFDMENLGSVMMEKGRFEEAQRFFQYASRLYPHHSAWAIGLAEGLLRQEVHPESALEHVESALKLFHHGAERMTSGSRLGAILATRAWALAACGRGAEAREAIDAALKGPARKTKGPLAEIHYKAGMAMLALSDKPGAVEHFALGSQFDPVGRWGRHCTNALQRQGPAV